ncbi:MAG: SdrD B-like domain-containing protein [Candidatus Competibacteraceae bacterium]
MIERCLRLFKPTLLLPMLVGMTIGLLGGAPVAQAHNLQTHMVYMFLDKDTQDCLDARIAGTTPTTCAALPGWTPGTPILQVNDEVGLITKVIPDPAGTATGVGGHVDFYVPNGVTVVDVAYLVPDGAGGFIKAGMKGQSPIAIGDGPIGAKTTPELIGLSSSYASPNGITTAPVTTVGTHRGTIAGVYGDTGIFFSTDPSTAWGSWQTFTGDSVGVCGSLALHPTATGKTITNNSGDVVVPCNKWDAEQLFGWGAKGTTYAGAALRGGSTAIVDYPDQRGNAPWGFASGVAGPQSGYAWEFDWDAYKAAGGNPLSAANIQAGMTTSKIGPWQRIKYPGSRISFDQPGLISTTLGYASKDASSLGVAANTLPATISQTDNTSVKTIRWAVGQLTQGRPEYVWVKVKINNVTKGSFLDASGCPFFHSDTFGGDAGGTSNGKDHLWRYYEPSIFTWNGCYAAGKPADLQFSKVNDIIKFKVKAYNLGDQTLTGVTISDTLPSGLQFISAAPAQNSGPSPLVWNIGTWVPGQKFEATLTAKVTGTGTLNNCLIITSNERPPQNTCDNTITNLPYLITTKSATPTTITPGAPVTYTMTVKNIGTGATGNPVTVTDFLPAGFTYQSLGTVKANGAVVTATVNSSNPSQPVFTVPASILSGNELSITFTAATSSSLSTGSYCNTYSVTQNGVPVTTGSEGCVTVGGGQIGDTVYRDWNGNGVQDAGEEGISGVTVQLYKDVNGNGIYDVGTDTAVTSTTTDSNGNYLFTGLLTGNYVVVIPTPPANYTNTGNPPGGTSNPLNQGAASIVGSNDQVLTVDFGYQYISNSPNAGTIGDQVFDDKNKDGVFNGSDVGISGVTVNLYEDTNGNGTIDTGDLQIGTTTTNGSGIYSFTGLDPTLSYLVQAVDGPGSAVDSYFPNPYQLTTGSNPVKVTPAMFTAQGNNVTTADFGYFGQTPGSIGDQVFIDTNGDDLYTPGEPGIGGVTVQLYIDADNDGQADSNELFKTTLTDANGTYGFPDLGPNNYIVVVNPNDPAVPDGYYPQVTQIKVPLTAGQNVTTADFPFHPVLEKTVSPTGPVGNGSNLTYTLKPTYAGSGLLAGVRIFDPLPLGATNVSGITPSTGTYGAYTPIAAVPGNDAGPPVLDTAITVSSNIVTKGGSVTVTLNVKSSVAVSNVSPTNPTVVGGDATCTGPTPASANVPAGGTGVNFAYTCTLQDVAEYIFVAGAENAAGTTSWPDASSASVLTTAGGNTNVVTWNLGSNSAGVPGISTATGSVVTGVYAFQGGGKKLFSRYGLSSQAWLDLTNPGVNIAKGGALTTNNTYIWAFQGGTQKTFYRYTLASPGSWSSLASTPDKIDEGGALQYLNVSGTEYVYALMGNSNSFRRYDVSSNSWSPLLAATPANVKKGGSLTTDGTYIYALQGDTKTGFWRCNATTNNVAGACSGASGSWTSLANTPANVGWGGSLTRVGNYIYALGGNNTTNFWRCNYTTSGSAGSCDTSWQTRKVTPGKVQDGGALTTDGTYIYAFQGKTNQFWRYEIATDSWVALTNYTYTTGQGGALVYVQGTAGAVTKTNVLTAAPTLVTTGDSFTVTMKLTSTDPVSNVSPTLSQTGTNGATASCTLQAPTTQNMPANGTLYFTWNCTATAAGTLTSPNYSSVTFTSTPSGWTQATSNSVLISPVLTFTATNLTFPTSCEIDNTGILSEQSGSFGTAPSNTIQTGGTSCGASLGDRVWSDTNGNGVQDSGEPGIAGVQVYIDTNGNGVYDSGEPTATTDVNGIYNFYGKPAGTYTVRTVVSTYPAEYVPTTPDFVTQLVAANSTNNNFDFGLQPPLSQGQTANIGDYVWLDANKDGLQDPGEQPLPGITIKLYHDLNGNGVLDPTDPLVGTQVTDATGKYLFTDLPAGAYLVQVDTTSKVTSPYTGTTQYNLGDVMSPTTGTVNPKPVTLTAGVDVLTADFGYNWSGVVGDTVFYDTNGNGTQNGGEAGAPNVTLVIVWDQNGNGVVDNLEPAVKVTSTNGSGVYNFTDMPPGNYVVQAAGQTVASPSNPTVFGTMVPTASYGEDYAVSLTTGQMSNLNADFGFIEAARVGGTVFHDANHSGVLDSGETGLTPITVTLTGTDLNGNPVSKTTTTDAGGNYTFLVPPGNYTVSYATSQTTALGYPEATTPTSLSFTALAGQEFGGLNFGVDNSGSLGNRVWNDANGNGTQDSGEPGIPGVTVNLYASNGTTLLATTATDANGLYSFPGLANDTYVVKVDTATLPTGFTATGEGDPGTACGGGCDSSITASVTGGAANNTVDFGYKPAGTTYSVSGNVYDDNNTNGSLDGGDTGIGGVTVIVAVDTDKNGTIDQTYTVQTAPNGSYSVSGIPAGSNVTITVDKATLPSTAYVQTGDPDGTLDNKTTITNIGGNVTNQNFGYNEVYGSITGKVCLGNGDGQCGTGETGIGPGVTVTLKGAGPDGILGTADDTTQTTTTAANGTYSFNNLVPDLYQVLETNPIGVTSLADADGGNPDNITVTLALGQNVTGRDFEDKANSIGDYVWFDTNHNGIQEPSEPGIAGVTVVLSGTNSLGQTVNLITQTDGSGFYTFGNLLGGNYTVTFTAPAGYSFTLPNQGTGPLADSFDSDAVGGVATVTGLSGNNVTIDAGLYLINGNNPARIGDRVWYDSDNDGVQDANEPGLAGVTVKLRDSTGTTVLATTVTDGNGNYEFAGLPAGTYVVEFVSPAGYTRSPQDAGGNDNLDSDANPATGLTAPITLSAGQNLSNVDSGMYIAGTAPASIGDRVWYDTNGNGIQDSGEPGLPGVTVKLYNSAGSLVATTQSDLNGLYAFTGLPAGNYTVQFVAPTGDVFSPQGINDGNPNPTQRDSDPNPATGTVAVTLTAGQTRTDIDAGLYNPQGPSISIGDYVWMDLNFSVSPDSGEGLPGVQVVLYDNLGNELVRTTTTAANANYLFTGVGPGSYRVAIDTSTLPPSAVQIADPDGTLDNRTDLVNQTTSTTAVDFGYNVGLDYGDLPDSYGTLLISNGARHVIKGVYIGSGVTDAEPDGQPTANATGDNLNGSTPNDENGVVFNGALVQGQTAQLTVTASATGVLNAWADWNNNGVFDTGERILTDQPLTAGVNTLTVSVPAGAVAGPTAFRFRVTDTVGQGGDSPIGLASSGEVEDYRPTVYEASQVGTVNGTIYTDVNGDGVYTPGTDTPLPGVQVKITASDGTVYTVTTDANGHFSQVVPAGNTTVDVNDATLPAGSVLTTNTSGQGSDPTVVNVPAGGTATDNTGYVTPAQTGTVQGTIYTDTNGNGQYDAGIDTPLPGVQVKITASNGGIYTVTTDTNGFFSQVVPPGNTTVDVNDATLPAGSVLTSNAFGQGNDPTVVNVPANGIATDNTGYVNSPSGTGTVDGTIYKDMNGNGQYDPGTDTPLPGVTVTITSSTGGTYTVTTNASGYFSQVVPPGSTTVDVNDATLPPNLVLSPNGGNSDPTTVTVPTGGTATDNTGYETPAPGLSLDKTATPHTYAAAGQVISYSYKLTNTGNVSLSACTVSDNKVTVTCPSTTLAPGAFITCTASYTIQAGDLTNGSVTNTAGGTCQGPSGNVTSNTDSETVTALRAAIGNRVWLDENGNGVQDAGEDGIANLTVELRNSSNQLVGMTVTDADGGYLFPNVPPGIYTVTVIPTAGLNPTYDENGIGTPNVTTVTVAGGEEHLTADFGYNWVPPIDSTNPGPTTTGAIGDRVWNDTNGNGLQDPGEAGIPGVTVKLLQDTNGDGVYGGTGDAPAVTTTTNASGNYIFDGLPQGAYVVEVSTGTLPAGTWTQTGDPDGPTGVLDNRTTQPILLAPGDVYVNADFGYQRSQGSTIGDTIYLDANGNGVQNVGEPGIPGVTVALLDSTSKVIATTITDQNGQYLFPRLPAGTYTVVVTDTDHVLGEVVQTGDPDESGKCVICDGRSTITVNGTSNYLDRDFGYAPPGQTFGQGAIGDTIFLDRNGNNTFDAGEGLEGVTVNLFDSTGTTLLATTVTNENGQYIFGGLNPTGSYQVRVDTTTLPNGGTGLTNTVDPDGGANSQAVRNLASAPGGIDLNADFGYSASSPNTIGGTLWKDRNGNGVLDASEPGRLAGVTLVLLDNIGNVVATTITDASGNYSFTGLPDGTYKVDVTDDANLLEGYWKSTGPNAGQDNNSQVDPYQVTVSGGQINTTGDFGYFIDGAALGNRVWKDFNGDGIQQTTETDGVRNVLLKIVITYPNGAVTTAYTTSNTVNGGYRFGNLLLDESFNGGTGPGQPTYSISVVNNSALTGYTASPQNGTSDPKLDSNNPAGSSATVERGQTDTTVLVSNPGGEPANASYDFGYVPTGTTPPVCTAPTYIKQVYPAGSGTLRVVAMQFTATAAPGLGITSITCTDTNGNGAVILPPNPPSNFNPPLGGYAPPNQVLTTVWRDLSAAKMALPAAFACTATDELNNTAPCDPVTMRTVRYTGKPQPITLTEQDGLVPLDKWLTVVNHTPGISQLDVTVNGVQFKLTAMQDNQEYTLDISSAMLPSGNVVTLLAKGRPGDAEVVIGY